MGTSLIRFHPDFSTSPVGPGDVHDLAPLSPRETVTYEIGYKGIINDRLRVNANVYYEKNRSFIFLSIVTPLVALEPVGLGWEEEIRDFEIQIHLLAAISIRTTQHAVELLTERQPSQVEKESLPVP